MPIDDRDRAFWGSRLQPGWPAEPDEHGIQQALGSTYEFWSGRTQLEPQAPGALKGVSGNVRASWVKSVLHESREGWPFQSFHRTAWFAVGNEIPEDSSFITGSAEHGVLTLPSTAWLPRMPQRDLPITPPWVGFSLNSMLYAAALWAMTSCLAPVSRSECRLP